MDRNREARRAAASMAAAPNGLSRRRHRSNSLRNSPEEDGPVELQETARLRDRGLKKGRERDRVRERERERTSRSSTRWRGERLMNGGDDSSEEEESVNDEQDDEEDVDVAGAFTRMLPPLPNPVVSAPPQPAPSISTNHNHSHHHHQHRKTFPLPTAAKVFKAAAVPAWKAADEMIGVSVPRKARSVSTKRSHDWISDGGGEQMIHGQASTSPVRHGLVSSTPSPAAGRDAPLSPPLSSNASVRKKIKPNGGGAKSRPPPKSATTSKSSSSNNNPEELEIEIAEVLYGLMTQSQAPPKNDTSSKFELNNKSSSDAKSRVSSPASSSSPPTSILPQNSSSSAAPLSAAALKKKKPRQVADNNLMGSSSTRSSPVMKVEIDQTPRNEISSPNLERNSGSAAENGDSLAEAKNQSQLQPLKDMKLEATVLSESKGALTEEAGESRDVVLTKEEVNSLKKESTAVKLIDSSEDVTVTSTVTATKVSTAVSQIESKREEKIQIDLMAPPPQLRASPERDGAIDFAADRERMVVYMEKMGEMIKDKEDNKLGKTSKEETVIQSDEKRAKVITEVGSQKLSINKDRNIDLQFDMEKPDREVNKLLPHQVPKSQLLSPKATLREEQPRTDKVAQPSSLPLPMSVASWPGGLPPPLGYMAPLQGVVSMDGSAMSSAPIQPLFSQSRPKRCATHFHIARNIHYYQQLMKMNPFWPAVAGSPSMFGAKPCNLNVIPSSELHGNIPGRSVNSVQDKGQGLAIFPGHAGKDKVPQPVNVPDSAAQRKQQILLQQALPPVAPSNILHGPAFIFPCNQQQAAVAAVSVRPTSAKSPTNTGSLGSSGAPASATVITSAQAPAAATGLSFNYPNMPYSFPIPAVGAPPNFGGIHAQPMPMFKGSFYPSQMIHPSQLQQQQPLPSQQQQIQQAHQNTSSGSTSSQKHLQNQQQRPQGSAINGGGTVIGNLQNFPAPKNRSSQHTQQHQNQHITPPQERRLESEMVGEDTPSTADSRLSRATMNIYGHNFAMPIRPQNFGLMTSSDALAGASQSDKKHHHHHQVFKAGVESLPPQAFAMSFGHINGSTSTSGIGISSMAQNHAILQSLPEAARQSYHQSMHAATAAQVAQQKKNSRMSEDGKSGGGDSSNADEKRQVIAGKAPASSGGQSIAFSRPDLTDASESGLPGNSVVDTSARTLNLASGPTRMPSAMGTVGAPNSHLQAQLQHQQQPIIQLHNQQQHQQQLAARSKMPATSNGSAYSEHLISSSSIAAKFPNSLSGYPQNFVQSSNTSSLAQSPQWKNSTRTPTSQVQSSLTSSTSSLKNHPQQQTRTQQSHTQISFGANQKPSASQGQPPPSSSSQSPSSVVVGSPTHSSISKGASASPRTTTASTNKSGQASTMSSQQAKNASSISSQKSSPIGGRNVPSILGNPLVTSSSSGGAKTQIQLHQQHQQLQQLLSKQTLQQALFVQNPYLQSQPPNSSSSNASAASGYYLQRRHPEQLQQPQGTTASSSTGMLSLCTPVTLSSTSTTDPAKAVAAAAAAVVAAASNMKGGGLSSQGTLHAAQFGAQSSGNSHQLLPVDFSYGHSVPAAVQVKPAEQKQPAGMVRRPRE